MNGSVVMMNEVAQVCIPHTHYDHYDYLIGQQVVEIGARVTVPFRNKTLLGVVIGKTEKHTPGITLKTIIDVIDTKPLLQESLLALCQWVSRYYQASLAEIIPFALPKNYRLGKPATLVYQDYYQLTVAAIEAHQQVVRRAAKQHALIDYLASFDQALSKRQLLKQGFSTAQLQALLNLKLIDHSQQADIPFDINPKPQAPLPLNEQQEEAVKCILARSQGYHCFLLQGVTGSGKTEVYLQVITEVLARQQQVLILVPEIGLTPQLLARFHARFAETMVIIHSALNEGERQQAWQLAYNNQAKLVIGTRAAIFTPMPALGLIVVDEEHDASLKQMEGVRYSARDTALVRASAANIPIILGSATPSLESLRNSQQGKYQLLRLDHKALTSKALHFQVTDLRNIPLRQGLADSTLATIAQHLQANNQVLVFINRRGYAPVVLCHQCGWMADCRACDSHMTLHRPHNRLICHHCGLGSAMPAQCAQCASRELIAVGAGTQRIYDYLASYFPNTNLLRIDRDEVRKKQALDQRLEQILRGEAQLIVGTQMLAKGHHFPRLSLVVILDVDAAFYNQDFRALERLGQLLTQVAGRAGRAEHAGEVIIQTHLPQHPLLNLLVQQGYEPFANALLKTREQAALPPYHYLAVIHAQDKKSATLLSFLHQVKDYLHQQPIEVLGPAPAPLARKANQHRMQLLLKSSSRKLLQSTLTTLKEWLTMNKQTANVRWHVDVDPMDLS